MDRLSRVAMVGAPALAAVAARWALGPRTVDDAFITLRYARNLADGQGLVYNPGEWVLGTTTPAWAGLLALLHWSTRLDLQWLALTLAAAADGGTAALLAYLARRQGWQSPAAAAIGLCWAIAPLSITYATGGMETSLFVLGTLAALTLAGPHPCRGPAQSSGTQPPAAREAHRSAGAWRAGAAAALAGSLYLVRPEGAIVLAAVLASLWLGTRRFPARALVVGLVPPAAWSLVALLAYGNPLPQSVAAKSVAYQGVPPGENSLALVFHAGSPGWSTFALAGIPAAVALAVVSGTLVVLGVLLNRAWLARPAGRAWLPFALFGAGYVLFHTLAGLRGVRLFPWYLVPMVPLYLLLVAAGLRDMRRVPAWLPILALLGWHLLAVDWQQPFSARGLDLRREAVYSAVGADLARQYPSSTTLAAPEIGALGYFSGLRVLDTVGLVSPAAARYYPLPPDQLLGDNAVPPRLLEDRRPDLVVSLDQFVARSLLADPWFLASYLVERRVALAIFQSRELLVFRRTDLPRP